MAAWYRYLFSGSSGWSILKFLVPVTLRLPATVRFPPGLSICTSPISSAASPTMAPLPPKPPSATMPLPPLPPPPLPLPPEANTPNPPMPIGPVASPPNALRPLPPTPRPAPALPNRPSPPSAERPWPPTPTTPGPPLAELLSAPRAVTPLPPSPLLAASITASSWPWSGTVPVKLSGTVTASGEPRVPLPDRVESCVIENNAPLDVVVCTVPSGNFNPPTVVSIIPCTVRVEVGVVVPIPIWPSFVSVIMESPMNELLPLNPVHLVNCPTVPPPSTGRFGPVPKKNGSGFFPD